MISKIRVCGNFLLLMCLIALVTSCSKGPSESQVIKDWEAFVHDSDCSKDVKFKKVEVIGTSKTDNVAEVIIRITGDWIGGRDLGWFSSTPCGGFHAQAGQNQIVERKFIYKKFDTGWRLERKD